MDKYLANYMFSNEVLFNIDAKNNTGQAAELVKTVETEKLVIAVKEIVETTPAPSPTPIVEAASVAEKIPGLEYAKQKLLVIINNLTAADKQLLEKILGSVKQNITEVSILDISTESIDLNKVLAASNSKIEKVLSFGVAMSNIQLNILLLPYQVSSSQNVTFLMVDDMTAITTNLKDEKRLLWAGLKTMFGLG